MAFVSLLCLALAACGGGDATEADLLPLADSGSAGNPAPPRIASLPAGRSGIGLTMAELQRLSAPWGTPNEALPAGVPAGYDWRERSRVERGNTAPAGYTAFTGWAQAFWIVGAAAGSQRLELRAFQVLLCTSTAAGPVWQRVQQGEVDGASFGGDYAGNQSVVPEVVSLGAGQSRVSFGADRAYHFWPRQGRVALPAEALCGMLVLMQARAVAPSGAALPAGTAPALLLGGGADYWLSLGAPWDNYRTNAGVGSGQLQRVGVDWAWHGMGTAGPTALGVLTREGYVDRTRP